jgi:hypothetical protein
MAFGDQSRPCATARELVPLLHLCRPTQPGVLTLCSLSSLDLTCLRPSTREEQMFDVSETLARQRLFRKTAMVAVVVPVALLAACGQH